MTMLRVILLVAIAVIGLPVFIGWLVSSRRASEPAPATPTKGSGAKEEKKKKGRIAELRATWQKHQWLPISIAIAIIHITLYKTWPHWWLQNVIGNLWWSILYHAMFVIVFDMLPERPDLPWKRRVARVAILFLTAGVLALWFKVPGLTEKYWEERVIAKEATAKAAINSGTGSGSLPENPAGEADSRKFWNSTDLEESQKEAMIEHERKESGFNQFRPNGEVYRNPASSAMGRMQIMESLWGDEAKENNFDLSTPEGNHGFALYLVKKRIAEGKRFDIDWDRTSPARVIELTLESGKVSEEILTFGNVNITSDGPITIVQHDGVEINDHPDRPTVMSCTSSIKLKSRRVEPVKATVTRLFTPCR